MEGSTSSDIEVAEFAGQLFFRLWRASHTRTADALTPLGLTPALFAVLNVLGAREGTIQQQLSSEGRRLTDAGDYRKQVAGARDGQGEAAPPLVINPRFDSGDHLHPNDAGYQAMANAIPLRLLLHGPR
jgi:hypothetical protein